MDSPVLLKDFLLLFLLASVVLWVFHKLKLPSITGFLAVGFLVGPFGAGWVREVEAVQVLADIGVVLLLFTIGAEFSTRRLIELRRHALGGGFLQVTLTIAAIGGLAFLTGTQLREAFVLGCLASLSSTAVVMRTLSDRGETAGPTGRAVLGMLIFQDFCVVPLMLAFSVLGGREGEAPPNVGLSLLAFAGLLVAARLLIPRLLEAAARTRSHELFVFVVGLIVLGAAWISSEAGLSLALGAFVAGIVVADNAYSHQVLTEVLPFRESFVGLFFTSVGMLLDPSVFVNSSGKVAAWLGVILAGKMLVVFAVGALLRYSWPVALKSAFALAQVGEFSFVLAGAAVGSRLLSPESYQVMVAVTVLSMMTAPFVYLAGVAASEKFGRWGLGVRVFGGESGERVHARAEGLSGHVIIVGFGLNGRRLAASLRHAGLEALALEIDPGRLRRDNSAIPLLFGDASSAEVLDAAGLERAIALVVAVSDVTSTQRILQTAQHLAPGVPVIARTRHLADVGELYRLGAREVVVEEVEASLEILLLLLGIAGLDQRAIRTVIAPYLKKGPRRGRPEGRSR